MFGCVELNTERQDLQYHERVLHLSWQVNNMIVCTETPQFQVDGTTSQNLSKIPLKFGLHFHRALILGK